MAFFVVGIVIILVSFLGIVYFMYRYMFAKRKGVKERSYDLTGMIFLIFPFLGGVSGFVGKFLEKSLPNPDYRILCSVIITVALLGITSLIVRHFVNKKVEKEKMD
ncbi:MAG: hypothetical protein K6A41_06710 [Bacteroidales bacterium]|nr:hypothetical protein [Bacteroidales bacterium]